LDADYAKFFTNFQYFTAESPVPSRGNVTKMYNKFLQTGSVADASRLITATTPEIMEIIALLLAFFNQPFL
jgi:hypothetical protein